MAGYFDQCACGEYTCVGDTPCRKCLEAEINRLQEENALLCATNRTITFALEQTIAFVEGDESDGDV